MYEDTEGKEATGANEEYEKSEMLLYKNMIIHEGGDLQKVRPPSAFTPSPAAAV